MSKRILRIGCTPVNDSSELMDTILRCTGAIPHGQQLSNHSRLSVPAELIIFQHRVRPCLKNKIVLFVTLFVALFTFQLSRRVSAFDYVYNCVDDKWVLAVNLSYYVLRYLSQTQGEHRGRTTPGTKLVVGIEDKAYSERLEELKIPIV